MLPSLHSENNPFLLAEGVRNINLVDTESGARIEFNPRVRNARLAEWWKVPQDCFLHQFSSYLPHLLHFSCLPSPLKSWNKQRTFNIKNSDTTNYAEINVSPGYHFCNDHQYSSDIIRIKASSSASRARQAAPAKWSVCNLWSAPPQSSSKRPHIHAATSASVFCGNWITMYKKRGRQTFLLTKTCFFSKKNQKKILNFRNQHNKWVSDCCNNFLFRMEDIFESDEFLRLEALCNTR